MTSPLRPTDESNALADRLRVALGAGYVVERELGAGGFAMVFLVRDITLKRQLAVKVLSPEMTTSPVVVARFRREAETVAQLAHPHIVPLHFVGEKEGLFYLAMGFIDGGSLADRMGNDAAPMPIEEVRRALSEVAVALAYAHARGVIHRDIKPQNVLVDAASGRCLVTDFGIARTAEASSLTATGITVGTPAYLAPEQVVGEPSDHRADIFALGVMGYELATGRLPYVGATPTSVLMQRLVGPPEPMSKYRPDIPRDLQDVVDGCLATDPSERFQNCDEVGDALGGVIMTAGGRVIAKAVLRKQRGRRKRQLMMLGAGIALVGGVAAIATSDAFRGGVSSTTIDSGMVLLPAGSYVIGNDTSFAISRPAHSVELAAFGIDAHEVTIKDYMAYVGAKNALPPFVGPDVDSLVPVTGVPWADAANYCAWRHPNGGELPSEQQWEAAAGGREHRAYPWGSKFDSSAANTLSARRSAPAPVGSYPRGNTPDGISDLAGNVFEWTRTSMGAYPGAPPVADSLRDYRVIRGGAYATPDSMASSWYRGYVLASTPREYLGRTGFRCVMPAQ